MSTQPQNLRGPSRPPTATVEQDPPRRGHVPAAIPLGDPLRSSDDDSERGAGPDPLLLLRHAVLRHKWSILALSVVGLGVGIFRAAIQPNVFESVAKLQLRLGAREQRTPEGAIIDEFQRLGSGVVVADVLQVFGDPMVHDRVVARVGVDTILQPEDPRVYDDEATSAPVRWMHALQAWWIQRSGAVEGDPGLGAAPRQVAAEVAQSTLDVSTVFGQNTITVAYTALSPERARAIVQAYIDVFRERHREIYESESQFQFLQEQFDEASEKAAEVRRKLEAMRAEHQIVDFDRQTADVTSLLLTLTNQLESERVELLALQRQLADLDERFSDLEPVIVRPPRRISSPNPLYPILIGEQRRAILDLEELAMEHPQGSAAYASRADVIQKRLERIEAQLVDNGPFLDMGEGEETYIENPVYEDVVSRRIALQQETVNLAARIEEREQQLARHTERFEELRDLEVEYRRLESELERLDARVASMSPALDRARVLQLVESDERLSNLKVVQEPTFTRTKVGPSRFRSVLAGLVGGALVGALLAFVRRILDPRLRFAAELGGLHVELLGRIEERRPWRAAVRAQRRGSKGGIE